ncbi:hypothetical protein [Bacillus sp. FJAT-29937]|uniref:hypothetical protein n=1 Tax=Bacillus sp. FJAT-29937 TaxID=1720553 RepID=UPI00082BE779|nr:hypothetical protein [Bacillus sp. FJAT-29937]
MKKVFGFLFVLLIGVIAAACSNETVKNEDVEKLVKEYKTEQYHITDPANPPTGIEIGEKVKKYLSEDAFAKLNANRVFQLAPKFAKQTNKTIELEDIVLEKIKEHDDGRIDYKYTLKLKVSYEQPNESYEIFDKEGQLSVSNTNEGLKITRDWEQQTQIEDVPI